MLQVEFLTQIMYIAQHTSTEAQPAAGAAKMPTLKMQEEKKSIACFKISLEKTFLCLNALFKKKKNPCPSYRLPKVLSWINLQRGESELRKTSFLKSGWKALSLAVSHHQRSPIPLQFSSRPPRKFSRSYHSLVSPSIFKDLEGTFNAI